MTARINDRQFKGMIPKLGVRHLPDGNAARARHCDLGSGELRPVKEDKYSENIGVDAKAILSLDGQWYSWDDERTIIKSPVVDDDRYIVSGNGPARTLRKADLIAGAEGVLLGVPKPATPTATLALEASGTGDARDIFYAVQFVNEFGDIGDKSEPTAVLTTTNKSQVTITDLGQDPVGYGITHQQLYRWYKGQLWFIAKIPITQTRYTDALSDALLVDPFDAEDHFPPPEDLRYMQSLSNGVMAGLSGTADITLSEPYLPAAYRPDRAFTVPLELGEEIIGLSSFDDTITILTSVQVHLLTVFSPETVNFTTLADRTPCASRRSIVQMRGGVAFATFSGYYFVAGGVAQLITGHLFDESDWVRQDPASIHAVYVGERLIWCYTGDGSGGYILDFYEQTPELTEFGEYADLFTVQDGTDDLYFRRGPYLWQWRGGDQYRNYLYHSRTVGEASLWHQTAARLLSCDYGQNPTPAELLALEADRQDAVDSLAAHMALITAVNILAGGEINGHTINGGDSVTGLGLTNISGADANGGINGDALPDLDLTPLSPWFGTMRIVRDCDGADDEDTVKIYSNEAMRLAFLSRARFVRYELTGQAAISQADIGRNSQELFQ